MKRILILLIGLMGVAYGQFSPTSAKQAFKWGVSIGTRDSSAYAANDSLVVVINRQGRMMYRSTDGYWKILGNSSDSSAILSQVVRTFGAQNVAGVKTFTADTTRFNIAVSNKSINGGADTLFSGDPYVGPFNTFKSGFIHHYYGISDNGNGGGDITYFKENGMNYKRLSNVSDRRVLPGEEIWYEQYSAHNGLDSIYSRRSIAAISVARASSNSTFGNMRGWYEIVTARDSGYKTPPTTKDFIVSEGRMAVNAPSNSTNTTFTSTANIYGDLLASNGLISNNLRVRNNPSSINYLTYVNGSSLAFRVVGNTFDNLQVRSGARPIVVQGGSTSPPMYLYNDGTGGGITMSETQLTGYYQTSSLGQFIIANNEIVRFNNAGGPRWGIGTGNTLAATLHVRGSISSTAAVLVSNNANAELFRINNGGEIIANTGFTGIRGRFTSLVVNKDSLPINTNQVWFNTSDTTEAAGTNRVGRRNLSNVLTSSITFDTTTRVLSIPTLSGGSSSVVIPRGTASGSSGIVALSSSRSGNIVTVSGDNGSTTTFSIRDADSTTRANLIAGNGLSGSSYNGVSAVTWTADTTVISTKNNVNAGLVTKVNVNDTAAMLGGYARLSGATFTDTIRGTVGIFEEKLTAKNTISVKNAVDTPTVQLSWTGTDNGVIGVYSGGGAAKIAIVGNSTSYFNGGKVLVGTTTESPDNEEFQVSGAALVSGAMKASSFARIGGTSSQFQMGDGSVRLLGVMPISLKTANYTLTTNDHTVIFDCAAANRTVTLPAGVEGQIFVIKAKNASTNAAIITPNGSQTIEGNSTYSLSNTCGDSAITIQFISGNWEIISSYLPPCL